LFRTVVAPWIGNQEAHPQLKHRLFRNGRGRNNRRGRPGIELVQERCVRRPELDVASTHQQIKNKQRDSVFGQRRPNLTGFGSIPRRAGTIDAGELGSCRSRKSCLAQEISGFQRAVVLKRAWARKFGNRLHGSAGRPESAPACPSIHPHNHTPVA
jgi:hypothetical protein